MGAYTAPSETRNQGPTQGAFDRQLLRCEFVCHKSISGLRDPRETGLPLGCPGGRVGGVSLGGPPKEEEKDGVKDEDLLSSIRL